MLPLINKLNKKKPNARYKTLSHYFHLDSLLLINIFLLLILGLFILYSATNGNWFILEKQIFHITFSLGIMFLCAQISPVTYQRWASLFYISNLFLLIAVLLMGHIGKGAGRWLTLGFIRFQPSEMMKLAVPLFLAWYCHKIHLPLKNSAIFFLLAIIIIPSFLIAKQPDLGSAMLVLLAGGSVLLLAGLNWIFLSIGAGFFICCLPIIWYFLYDYQRLRVFTFFNPESDPLGSGYHIIQSKIAIGSGGLFGKGFLHATQSHLHFLPEHATDFIFAVLSEEFGLIGSIVLILFFMTIVLRGLYITIKAQDTFCRLLAGSLTITFFMSFFINMGMVTGILPVVGLPLPLISYGGSSMVTLMASFGILMSIQTHRKLLTT